MKRISVVGLGKLGSCMAACFAARGFRVVGVDVNPRPLEALNAGRAPVPEPDLEATIQAGRPRLRAIQDLEEAVLATDATFIVVPTPSVGEGGFSLEHVLAAGASIGRALAKKSTYHLVVLTSTVLPGSMEHGLQRVLETTSGKRCGTGFGLCYNPEFIALGSVVHDLLHPDFYLVGESDAEAGNLLAEILQQACDNDPPIARLNFVNAELAKIALNTYVTMKITFANLLAETCERLPGADVDAVTGALGLDSRIGPKYLKGGAAYGGPCFPRDNIAFGHFLDSLGLSSRFPRVVHEENLHHIDRLARRALRHLKNRPGRVAVLGLSYKPGTPVLDASPGIEIARTLAAAAVKVVVHDPLALEGARKILGASVEYADELDEAVKGARCIILVTPWPEFTSLPAGSAARPLVIDAWRILRKHGGTRHMDYLGVGLADPEETGLDRVKAMVDSLEGRSRPVEAKSPSRRSGGARRKSR